MGTKRLIQIDPETGEEVDGFVAYLAPRRRNGFGTRWMAMAQDSIEVVALNEELTGEDLRVFLVLAGQVDFENLLVVNQAELARKMGWKRQNVQRAIKRLIKTGVILEGPKIGLSRSYRFNPEFGWKGAARNHVTALKDERERRMKAAGITGVINGGGKTQQPEPKPSEPESVTTHNPFCDDLFPKELEEATT